MGYTGKNSGQVGKFLNQDCIYLDIKYIVALKLKILKSIFVKIELSMDSCSHHHSLGLKKP